MTIYTGPTQPTVLGGQISPAFGVQAGGAISAASNPIVAPVPLAGIGQPQKTILEACAKGELPRNALVSSVAGVSCGAQNATPVDDLMGNGAGAQLNLGTAVPPNAGNPAAITQAGISQQIFVEGNANANDGLSTGPTPTNVETFTSAPVPASVTVGNVALNGQYQG